MQNIIIWLDGKKTFIGGLALIIIPYFVAQGIISAGIGGLLCTLIGLITGATKIITNKAVVDNSDLGMAIVQARLKK